MTTKMFACRVCSKAFKRKGDCERHEQIHTGKKPHKCPFCGKGFLQKAGLKPHINIHTGAKPYKCPVEGCDKSFADQSSRTRHKKERHMNLTHHHCPYQGCHSKIKRPSSFYKHLKMCPCKSNGLRHGCGSPSEFSFDEFDDESSSSRSSSPSSPLTTLYSPSLGSTPPDSPESFALNNAFDFDMLSAPVAQESRTTFEFDWDMLQSMGFPETVHSCASDEQQDSFLMSLADISQPFPVAEATQQSFPYSDTLFYPSPVLNNTYTFDDGGVAPSPWEAACFLSAQAPMQNFAHHGFTTWNDTIMPTDLLVPNLFTN